MLQRQLQLDLGDWPWLCERNNFILFHPARFESCESQTRFALYDLSYIAAIVDWRLTAISSEKMVIENILHGHITFLGIFGVALTTSVFLNYSINRVRSYQIHTIEELIDMKFRLAGTTAVLERIREQDMVGVLCCISFE